MLWMRGGSRADLGRRLWEHGFGAIFPEIDGEPGFDEQARLLDRIERLEPAWVIPGHGAPFTDVPAALARALRAWPRCAPIPCATRATSRRR